MKNFLILFIILISFTLLAADFEETRKFSLNAGDISKLYIDCGAGFLKVTGNKDSEAIFVTANISIDNIDPEEAERIIGKYLRLQLEERGSRAELISEFEYTKSFFSSIFNGHGNLRVDLIVDIPQKMDVDIDDGSGYIEIKSINGELYIDDGSDYMDIFDITGNIEIDDGSGDIVIDEVGGKVEIDDGSGEIKITNVKGDIFLDDGSGRISVFDIDGNVRVDDGSGSITIKSVEEDVIIEDDGSGSVHIRDIAGHVYRYDE